MLLGFEQPRTNTKRKILKRNCLFFGSVKKCCSIKEVSVKKWKKCT